MWRTNWFLLNPFIFATITPPVVALHTLIYTYTLLKIFITTDNLIHNVTVTIDNKPKDVLYYAPLKKL